MLLVQLKIDSNCSHLLLKMDFPGGSMVKNLPANAGDTGSIPGSGRSPGEGVRYPLQYSWASLVAQLVKSSPELGFRPLHAPWDAAVGPSRESRGGGVGTSH